MLPSAGIEEIIKNVNSYGQNINFTMEKEVNGGVPLLDTKLLEKKQQNNTRSADETDLIK